jgi:hypothetical protein
MEEFARRFGFTLSKRVRVDDGVSAFQGLNATPDHELGKFLVEAQKGLIRPGDCLLLENWDRLSRQNIWAAIGLVNDLRQLGIHVGRLDRMKLLKCDSTDPGDFFEAAVELMRGHSESAAKSMRNGAAWRRKRRGARDAGDTITHRLPAWVEEKDGKRVAIPERAAVIRRVFKLSAAGYGEARIVQRLTREKVAAFGPSGRWTRAYVALLLGDRRVLGEHQPRLRDGTPDGKPIPGYFPAVVGEEEFYAARGAAGLRRQAQASAGKPWTAEEDRAVRELPVAEAAKVTGRSRTAVYARRFKLGVQDRRGEGKPPTPREGKRVELFARLIRNARDGDTYYAATRTDGGKHSRVLINTGAVEGRANCCSFPLATFEWRVLEKLEEINPHAILNGDEGPDEAEALAGHHAAVEAELKEASAFMDAHGFSVTIGKRVAELEARLADLAPRLALAREKAAHPLSECWGEAQSLIGALEKAADPEEARLRLRAALRRIVDSIWLLVVPRGRDRLAAVQIWFAGGQRHRDYLILHRPPKANQAGRQEGESWAKSFANVAAPGDLDLRKRADAGKLAAVLEAVDLEGE